MKRVLMFVVSYLLSIALFATDPAREGGVKAGEVKKVEKAKPLSPVEGFVQIEMLQNAKVFLTNLKAEVSKAYLGPVVSKSGKFIERSGDAFICGNSFERWNWKGEIFPVDTSNASYKKGTNGTLFHSPGITEVAVKNAATRLLKYKQEGRTLTLFVSMGDKGFLPLANQHLSTYEGFDFEGVKVRQLLTNENLRVEFNKNNNGRDKVAAVLLHTTC